MRVLVGQSFSFRTFFSDQLGWLCRNSGETENEQNEEDDGVSTDVPTELVSVSEPTQRQNMTEAQRRALLKADPRAEEVRPHEVLCQTCRAWVKLEVGAKYIVANWAAHQGRCESGRCVSAMVLVCFLDQILTYLRVF